MNKPRRFFDSRQEGLTLRPAIDQSQIALSVEDILQAVKDGGDKCLFELERKFDKADLSALEVGQDEFREAEAGLDPELKAAIQNAAANILAFHEAQLHPDERVTVSDGIELWRKTVSLERVGLYIPGGSAPLFSTVLMLGIPAKVAGCREVIMCTPPSPDGKVNGAVLFAAKVAGIQGVYKVGGAQAIAAMAYGTETIGKCVKIFGPGNRFVTYAKMKVSCSVCSIDMPAGPSEVLVACDRNSDAAFAASDLLSQAEHGADSQAVMAFLGSREEFEDFADAVDDQIDSQTARMPRNAIIGKALENSFHVHCPDEAALVDFINSYAPEHLIIATETPEAVLKKVHNAGSVFLGKWSCESAGDYASGTNHTLPTSGWARSCSGVSTDSFLKKITVQRLSDEGLRSIGKTIQTMADAEGLAAHKNAVDVRIGEMSGGKDE